MKPDPDSDGYFEGQLLVATPQIRTSCFEKSVVYMCAHNAEGAMGIIINHPLPEGEARLVVRQLGLKAELDMRTLPVYYGGPVETERGFVLHSADYHSDSTVLTKHGLGLTSSLEILQDIVAGNGPRRALLAIGYSGWAGSQLEGEIEANSWFSVPNQEDIVFGADNATKWLRAAESVGVDPFKFSDEVGHA